MIKQSDGEEAIVVNFSIILETSDNLWMKQCYADTSNSAFKFYYLLPMSHLEGQKEMVTRYEMFDNGSYDHLYSQFGGHIRFYEVFWRLQKEEHSSDAIIEEFEKESKILMTMCLMHTVKKEDQMKIISLFEQLKRENFTLKDCFFLTPTIEQLISCNLLFYNLHTSEVTV